MREQWKAIPGYEGRYEVSDQGRVRSLDRQVRTVSRTGTETLRMVCGTVLKPQRHSGDYQQVGLAGELHLVHRLVLRAFVGPAPAGHEAAHGDGDKANNRLSNLRYATPSENAEDRKRHGTQPLGEHSVNARLTAETVLKVREAATRMPQAAVAARFGLHPAHVGKIVRRETWKHLP